MSRSREILRTVCLPLAAALLISSCSGEPPQGIRVPLSGTGSGGAVYALSGARFRITGPRNVTLQGDEAPGQTISAGLPVGDYEVRLLDGWTLVRLPDGAEMVATLSSPNPQAVTLVAGVRSSVVFTFDVEGEIVTMSDGDLDIGFEVRDDAGVDGGGGLTDEDGDGYLSDVDCDDRDAFINPGVMETCDAQDQDCDGAVDEDFMCVMGVMESCVTSCGSTGGRGCDGMCQPGPCTPPAEACNGVDDDCDGAVDEGCMACTPSAEVCDGVDNDCDAMTDEGVGGGLCGSAVGECTYGMLSCSGAMGLVCTGGVGPSAETCDGLDEDCDGAIDEANPGGGGACGGSTGACIQGVVQCVGGTLTCTGFVGPTAESCNGIDDDCDGAIDELNPGGGGACGSDVGECAFGALTCVAGTLSCVGGTGPRLEVCDGLDDDCDGVIDEGC